MSVSWTVLPIVPEVIDWLQGEHNFTIPEGESRRATVDELISVLETFNQPIRRKVATYGEQIMVSIVMGKLGSETFAQISGSVDDGEFHFSFEKSGNTGRIMLTILKQLSKTCGAQAIYSNGSGSPVPWIVTVDIDIDEALHQWWFKSSDDTQFS